MAPSGEAAIPIGERRNDSMGCRCAGSSILGVALAVFFCAAQVCAAQSAPHGSLLALSKRNHTLAIAFRHRPRRSESAARHRYGSLERTHGLAFVGGKLWFTAEGAKAVARFDPVTNRIDWIMGTGQNRTHMLYVTADESQIYTTNVSSGTVSILEKLALPPMGPPPGMGAPPGRPAGPPSQGGRASRGRPDRLGHLRCQIEEQLRWERPFREQLPQGLPVDQLHGYVKGGLQGADVEDRDDVRVVESRGGRPSRGSRAR
jgi:hypothetical protein